MKQIRVFRRGRRFLQDPIKHWEDSMKSCDFSGMRSAKQNGCDLLVRDISLFFFNNNAILGVLLVEILTREGLRSRYHERSLWQCS